MSYIYLDAIIEVQKLEHLKDISYYNHNYYRITNTNTSEVCDYFGNNIILEVCDEFSGTYSYTLGKLSDQNVFEPVFEFLSEHPLFDNV